ncbi:hypothetical protein [Nitrospira sp. KM1]|uniref:hypothetical protein n=1 Tax=Nitrospira sp. KM1 TaxID=1936990 RepID=UPI0015658D91|nr:hypothetical protein [Nitrospira sp. KM1]
MRIVVVLLLAVLPTVVPAQTPDGVPSNAATVVKGDVLYWEGEELVVREFSGHEVRLRVAADTKIVGAAGKLKTGDKIEALTKSDGHTTSITLQIPGGASPAPPVPQ